MRFIHVLVIGQLAMSMVLLSVSILFNKQLRYINEFDPGFAKEELLTIPLNMHIGEGIYNEQYDVFAEELKKLSGVKNVTMSFSSPVNIKTGADDLNWTNKPADKKVGIHWNSVFFDYFETLDLNTVQGRTFNRQHPSDVLNDGKCAFVINESALAEMELADPLGVELEIFDKKGPVVGVVEDFNGHTIHSKAAPMCFFMNPFYLNEIIVRFDPASPSVLSDIDDVWQKFVPDFHLEFSYVTDQLNQMYKPEQNIGVIMNVFSLAAIFITCMGLIGLNLMVMQNSTKEVGIRKVNGAGTGQIMARLNTDLLRWIALAFTVSVPVSIWMIHRWMLDFAYKTEASWWIYAIAGLLTMAIALLTVSWQSFKAASRNPVEALRYE